MIGIAEFTMTGLYRGVGISAPTAFTVSVMTQMDSYIFEIGFGYIAMLVMNFVLAKREKRKLSIRSERS
jgi:uncharacterized membrane protein YbhN (UPF0104 family)